MKLILLCTAAMLLGFATVRDSQPKWRFIGDKTVAYGADHDVLHVTNLNDYFSKIKLRVTDAPLKIMDLKVHFENGDVQEVNVRSEIKQGGETRVIDLTGGSRRLKKLEFWYSTVGTGKGKSRVAVWGRR